MCLRDKRLRRKTIGRNEPPYSIEPVGRGEEVVANVNPHTEGNKTLTTFRLRLNLDGQHLDLPQEPLAFPQEG